MKNELKRIISLVCVLAMLVSTFPLTAFAGEDDPDLLNSDPASETQITEESTPPLQVTDDVSLTISPVNTEEIAGTELAQEDGSQPAENSVSDESGSQGTEGSDHIEVNSAGAEGSNAQPGSSADLNASNTAETGNTQQTAQPHVSVSSATASHSAEEIRIELSSKTPIAGQAYEVKVTAPGAGQIRFFNPADSDEPAHTADGAEYVFSTVFSAGNYSFSASACFNGIWTDKCDAFAFTVAEEEEEPDVTEVIITEEKSVVVETRMFASTSPALTRGTESHTADDISLTVSTNDIWVGEAFNFIISAPGASRIKLSYAGGYEMKSWDGDSAEYRTALGNEGEASFYASAIFDEEWVDSNPITINVQSMGTLDVVQADVPSTAIAGDTLSISWSPVENGTSYSYYLYESNGYPSGSGTPLTNSPLTISTAGLNEGSYTLQINAHGSKWISSTGYYFFLIEGDNTPAAPVVTVEESTMRLNTAPTFCFTPYDADRIRIRYLVTIPSGYTQPATETFAWGYYPEYQGFTLPVVGEYIFRFSVYHDGEWSSYSDPITVTCVTDGELKTPDFTIPSQITAGSELVLSMTVTEDAAWYSEHEYDGHYYLVINDEGGNNVVSKCLYFYEISDFSTLVFSSSGLEAGNYQASLWICADAGYETKKSEFKSFSIVGEMAAAPAVTTDKEQYNAESKVKFTVTASGAEKIAYGYIGSSSVTEVTAAGDVTVIELDASSLQNRTIRFAAYINGAWSAWTEWISVTVLDLKLEQPQATVQESITVGNNLSFSANAVEHADRLVAWIVQFETDDGYDKNLYNNFRSDSYGHYSYVDFGDHQYGNSFTITGNTTDCTVDGSRFVVGTYRLWLVARDSTDTYADSDHLEFVFQVTDSGLTPPTLSADKEEIWVDQPFVEIIATTETGTKVEFYISYPGGDYTTTEEATVSYGTAVYQYASTSGPGTLSVKARAWNGKVWSDYSEPLEIPVHALEKLGTPSAEIPKTITAGEDYTFEIVAEDAVENYRVYLYRTADNLEDEPVPYNTAVADLSGSKTVTIPAMHLTEGQYQISIVVSATHWEDSDPFEVYFKAVGAVSAPALTVTADNYTIKTCETVTFALTPVNFTEDSTDAEVYDNGEFLTRLPLVKDRTTTFSYNNWISSGEHTIIAKVSGKYEIVSEPVTVTVTSHGKLTAPTVEAQTVQSTEDGIFALNILTDDPPHRINGFIVTLTAVYNTEDVEEHDLSISEDSSYIIGWNKAGLYNITAKAYGTDYEPSDNSQVIQVLFEGYALRMHDVTNSDGEIIPLLLPDFGDLDFDLTIKGIDGAELEFVGPIVVPLNSTKTFDIMEDPIELPEGKSRKVRLLIAPEDDPDTISELAVKEVFKGRADLDATFEELGDFILFAVDEIDGVTVSYTRIWNVKVVCLSLTADKEEAWTCEDIIFSVDYSEDAGTVVLYVDGKQFASATLLNGKATVPYAFKQAGVRTIIAKLGDLTSATLELLIKCIDKLQVSEIVCAPEQPEPQGITISWKPVDHADGYVIYIRNEEDGIFYEHDYKKDTLEKDEDGSFILNIPSSALKGEGAYDISVWDYGYQYDQNGTDWISVKLVKPELSATITPETPEGYEKQDISFTVTVNTTECTAVIRDPSNLEITPTSSSVSGGKRTYTYAVQHETEGTYNYTLHCYGTGSMSSVGKLEKAFQVVVKGEEDLAAPVFSNIVDGDIVVDPSFTVEWYAPELPDDLELKEYCFDFYRWDDGTDWWTSIDHHPNIGLDQEYTLHDMIVGKPYRVEVYGITTNGLKTHVAVANFTYKTIPAFSLIENETVLPEVKGDKVTLNWNSPVWPGHPELKPTGYIIRLFGPGLSSTGEVVSGNGLSANATSFEIPGALIAEAGNYAVEVYAYIKEGSEEAFRVADGKNDFIIENPEISLSKPAGVCPYGRPIEVEGTVKGGISSIRLYIYDSVENFWIALVDAENNENYVVCSVDDNGSFNVNLRPQESLSESDGRYYLHTIGFGEQEGVLSELVYPDALPLKISTGEISDFTLYGYSQDGKTKGKYFRTWAYVGETTTAEVKTDTIIESAAVSATDFAERNDTGHSDNGNIRAFTFESFSLSKEQRYDFTAKIPNGKTAKAFIYAVTELPEQQGYVSLQEGQDTIVVRSLPDGNGNNTSTLKNGDSVQIVGKCGKYWLVLSNNFYRFILKKDIKTFEEETKLIIYGDERIITNIYNGSLNRGYRDVEIMIKAEGISEIALYVFDSTKKTYIYTGRNYQLPDEENDISFSPDGDITLGKPEDNIIYYYLAVDTKATNQKTLSEEQVHVLVENNRAAETYVFVLPFVYSGQRTDIHYCRICTLNWEEKTLVYLYPSEYERIASINCVVEMPDVAYTTFKYNNCDYLLFEMKYSYGSNSPYIVTVEDYVNGNLYYLNEQNEDAPEWRIEIKGGVANQRLDISQYTTHPEGNYRLWFRKKKANGEYVYDFAKEQIKLKNVSEQKINESIGKIYLSQLSLNEGEFYEFTILPENSTRNDVENAKYFFSYLYIYEFGIDLAKDEYYHELNALAENEEPLDNEIIREVLTSRLYSYGLDSEYIDDIVEYIDNAEEPYRRIYLYSLFDYNVIDPYYRSSKNSCDTYYNYNLLENGIRFGTSQYLEESDMINSYTSTWFHECGHAIDAIAGNVEWEISQTYYSENDDVWDVLTKDMETKIHEWASNSMLSTSYPPLTSGQLSCLYTYFLNDPNRRNNSNDLQTLFTSEVNPQVEGWNLLTLKDMTRMQANLQEDLLLYNLDPYGGSKRNAIMASDVTGGMTVGAITLYGGQHNVNYWLEKNGNRTQKMQCSEAFAEYMSAHMMGYEDIINHNSQFFHETCELFDSYLDDILLFYQKRHA